MIVNKIIGFVFPKTISVEILLPDKSMWVKDKAVEIPIEGTATELGVWRKLLRLQKGKRLIPKFTPERVRVKFGVKDKLLLYTPDNRNYYPLKVGFEDDEFGIKPEDYNHGFLVDSIKTHQLTRFKKEDFWKVYFPLIVVVVMMVTMGVFMKMTLGEIQGAGDQIAAGIRQGWEGAQQTDPSGKVPFNP